VAIGISGFAVYVTRKDKGRVAFAIAAIFAWGNVLATYFHDNVNQFLSQTSFNAGDVQSLLLILTVLAAIVGFVQQAT
jgi:hypothetical protein